MQARWYIYNITFLYVYKYELLVHISIKDRQYVKPLHLGLWSV